MTNTERRKLNILMVLVVVLAVAITLLGNKVGRDIYANVDKSKADVIEQLTSEVGGLKASVDQLHGEVDELKAAVDEAHEEVTELKQELMQK